MEVDIFRGCCQQRNPPGMPEAQCCLGTLCKKNLFDHDIIRPVLTDNFLQSVKDIFQPFVKWLGGRRRNCSRGDVKRVFPFHSDQSVAALNAAWINAKYFYERPIFFWGLQIRFLPP